MALPVWSAWLPGRRRSFEVTGGSWCLVVGRVAPVAPVAHVPELLIDDVRRWMEWVAAIPSLRCVAAMVVVREIVAAD